MRVCECVQTTVYKNSMDPYLGRHGAAQLDLGRLVQRVAGRYALEELAPSLARGAEASLSGRCEHCSEGQATRSRPHSGTEPIEEVRR